MGAAFSSIFGRNAPNDEDLPWLEVLSNPEYLDWRRGKDSVGLPLSQEYQLRVEHEQTMLPVQIHDFVYLADARSASRVGRIKYMGITHVLNLAGNDGAPKKTTFAEAGMVYKMIDAKDQEGYRILDKHLLEARGFIASARNHGGNVLVYCMTGYDVSGVIVAAEVMLSQKINVLEVVANLRRTRGNAVLQNASFQEQLVALARKEGFLGARPGQPGSIVRQMITEDMSSRTGSIRRNSGGSIFSGASVRSSFKSKSSSGSQPSFRAGPKSVGAAQNFDKSFKKMLKEADSFNLKRTAPHDDDLPYLNVMRDPEPLDWRKRPDPDTGMIPGNAECDRIEKEQGNLPVQISEHVYLGDLRAAKKIGRLKFMGITHVLNVAGPEGAPACSQTFAEAQILYRMIDARDRDGYPVLMRHLAEARDFVSSARAGGGKCLVYCMTGHDLSGVIVAADKMLDERMSVLQVVAHCRRRRGNAFLTSEGFQEQLLGVARSQNLLGSKPGSAESVVPQGSFRNRSGSQSQGLVSSVKRAVSFNSRPNSSSDLRLQVANGIAARHVPLRQRDPNQRHQNSVKSLTKTNSLTRGHSATSEAPSDLYSPTQSINRSDQHPHGSARPASVAASASVTASENESQSVWEAAEAGRAVRDRRLSPASIV